MKRKTLRRRGGMMKIGQMMRPNYKYVSPIIEPRILPEQDDPEWDWFRDTDEKYFNIFDEEIPEENPQPIQLENDNITEISGHTCNTFIESDDINLYDIILNKEGIELRNTWIGYIAGNIRYSFIYDNTLLSYIDKISEGSYGTVDLYGNDEYKLAVKTYKYQNDTEIELISRIRDIIQICNIVNIKLITIDYNKYWWQNTKSIYTIAIMDYMHGTLTDLIGILTSDEIFYIIGLIGINLRCLLINGYSYTDLNTNNILYKCIVNNHIKITLGDVGSICNVNDTHYASYPSYEYRLRNGSVICNETTMVWQLGILAMQLFTIDTTKYHYTTIKDLTLEQLRTDIKSIPEPPNDPHLFNKILDVNKTERCSLDYIITKI